MKLFLFGNQLFPVEEIKKLEHTLGIKLESIILAETLGLSSGFKYHKIKIAFVWIAMREHRDLLKKSGYKIEYYEISNNITLKEIINKTDNIVIFEPANKSQLEKMKCLKDKNNLTIFPSPMFLTEINDFEKWAGNKKKYFFNSFYIWQRRRLNILIGENQNPIGDSWSYDSQNREKLPKDIKVPKVFYAPKSKYFDEISILVEKYFSDNPGGLKDFWLPTTEKDALEWYNKFLESRFNDFGKYEDAITNNQDFLYHSAISPLLNIGLLTPNYVIKKALDYTFENNIPINSLEGFIRQIIGWREFIHLMYLKIGNIEKDKNFFNHKKNLNQEFYEGNVGILPVDDTINKVKKLAWSHHIERLMIMGNYMFLNEINPHEVYKWFMEMYVDAYEWVMIPNVYGMSQFADGGMISTKPYFSSSNYILKMSNYKKQDWCKEWDKLFWNFMYKNEEYLSTNPRLKLLLNRKKSKV